MSEGRLDVTLSGSTILFLNNFSGAGLGGGEIHMRAVVLAARKVGARVIVACHPGGDVEREFRELEVLVEPVQLHVADLPGSMRRVRRLVEHTHADILHSNGWLTNLVARLARDGLDVSVLNSVLVDPDAPLAAGASQLEQTARNAIDRSTLRHVSAFAPITRAVAAKLLQLGADPSLVHVIPGSVDSIALRNEAASQPAGFTRVPDTTYVGYVGRLETVKGVETLVRAAAGIAAARVRDCDGECDVRFVIGGAGSLEGELREIAVAHGLTSRLEFLGPVVSTAATFTALDIVVVPSLSEGFGIVAAEAMALGKPVIASRVGGLPEVVEDRITGVLVPPDDSAALALAIDEMIEDPEGRQAMGAAGRERVETEFTAHRMSQAYMALYAELLGES